MIRSFVLFLSIALSVFSSNAFAQICTVSQSLLMSKSNGILLVQSGSGWSEFEGFKQLQRPTLMSFALVVKEPIGERTGVITIKTATLPTAQKAWQAGQVHLVRDESSEHFECSGPRFNARHVDVKAYEDYHGKGWVESRALDAMNPEERSTNRDVLKRFHTKYRTSRGCRSSDATTYEGFEYRNNRSQFSFDTTVVDGGWALAITNLLRSLAPEALAGPLPRLLNQRTEIRHYTVRGAVAGCIMFNVKASGPDQVLRVNDLEDRIGLVRTGEKRWPIGGD